MKILVLLAMLSSYSFASNIVGLAKSPHGKHLFTMKMDDSDPIGSINKCMDRVEYRHVLLFRVHRKGGGFCQIEPNTVHGGKSGNNLSLRYPDVFLWVNRQ